jgi:hypothetical protein
MVIFHVVGKPDLNILVFNFRIVQVIENVFYAMFAFRRRHVHASKDVIYKDDNIVLNYIYKVIDVNPGRMFWTVTNCKYWIVNENVLNNFQDIVITPNTFASWPTLLQKVS